MIRGDERGSEKNILEKFGFVSLFCHSSVRLIRLVRKL